MPAGLKDVVAGESGVCYIDGAKGLLSYRGYNIHELAPNSTFEETSHLLWFGKLPTAGELEDTRAAMAKARAIPDEVISMMRHFPKSAVPMEALRSGVSLLSMFDPDSEDGSVEANSRKAIRLTAQVATVVAAAARLRDGNDPVPPRGDLSHAGNFYYMLTGEAPNEVVERALDISLILHADHELNASTFASRVTSATLADMYSAVTSGIGALKGPLHGGANANAMKLLLEIGDDSNVEAVVHQMFADKKKIPGFGHRVYTTEDPRATHLRRMSREAGERVGNTKWYDISAHIEKIVNEEKKLNANVDFYSASTYYTIGLSIDLFTPFFAVSRMAGWTAHVLEQYADNRLIRPRAEYIGPEPTLKWVPPDQRG